MARRSAAARNHPIFMILCPEKVGSDVRVSGVAAGQPAEALFTRNRQVTQQSIQEGASAAGESARKPRVLAISPPGRVGHEEVEAPISPNQQKITPKIRIDPGLLHYRLRAHDVRL